MKNEFIVKMRQGRRCVGTFSHISSEIAMEGLAYAGMDFVIIDGEHGTVGAETVQKLVSLLSAAFGVGANRIYIAAAG